MERYAVVRQIGKGSFGSVFLVQRRSDGGQFVLKQMAVSRAAAAKEADAYNNEVKLLSELQHPGIVSYIESFLDAATSNMCIVMSFCEGGDLSHFLSSRASSSPASGSTALPEAEILYHLAQMLLALLYMHDKHILHRDLKAANIFLKNGLLQLGDLGISKALNSGTAFASTCIGTPYYMSPELFKSRPYNHKSDVWALGCVLYEMCCGGRHAFDAGSISGLAAKIMKGGYDRVGNAYSKGMRDLIAAMLQVNPSLRPSVRDILLQPAVRRSVGRYVHVVMRHPEFYKERDIDNFVRQVQRLGFTDMLNDVAAPPPAAAAAVLPSSAAVPAAGGGGMVVIGVGGARKEGRKGLDLIREEEREKALMEQRLAELKELQAERERRIRERERQREASRIPRRSSGSSRDQQLQQQPLQPAAAAVPMAVERRREEEQRRKEEELRRRRERDRLRESERETERQQREADEKRRRQIELSREREKRQRDDRDRAAQVALQVRAQQRERDSRDAQQRRLYAEQAEQARKAMERIRDEGAQLAQQMAQLESDGATSERDRVLQRKERDRLQREGEERERLRAARNAYSQDRAKAAEWNRALLHGYGNGSPQPQQPPQQQVKEAELEDGEDEDAAVEAERAAMEAGKARIEQLTQHLHDYSRRLQSLKTTMQVTALIQEALNADPAGDDDDEDDEATDEQDGQVDGVAAASGLFVSMEERLRVLGRECVRVLGRDLFLRLYDFIAECRDNGLQEDDIQTAVLQREGHAPLDERWKRWRMVDQLLFMESHCDEQDAT